MALALLVKVHGPEIHSDVAMLCNGGGLSSCISMSGSYSVTATNSSITAIWGVRRRELLGVSCAADFVLCYVLLKLTALFLYEPL